MVLIFPEKLSIDNSITNDVITELEFYADFFDFIHIKMKIILLLVYLLRQIGASGYPHPQTAEGRLNCIKNELNSKGSTRNKRQCKRHYAD